MSQMIAGNERLNITCCVRFPYTSSSRSGGGRACGQRVAFAFGSTLHLEIAFYSQHSNNIHMLVQTY